MVSGLGRCCHDGSRCIQYLSLLLVVRFLVNRFLVKSDLLCDHALVSSLNGGCLVGFVYFGTGYHYSFDDYEGDFVVAESFL